MTISLDGGYIELLEGIQETIQKRAATLANGSVLSGRNKLSAELKALREQVGKDLKDMGGLFNFSTGSQLMLLYMDEMKYLQQIIPLVKTGDKRVKEPAEKLHLVSSGAINRLAFLKRAIL